MFVSPPPDKKCLSCEHYRPVFLMPFRLHDCAHPAEIENWHGYDVGAPSISLARGRYGKCGKDAKLFERRIERKKRGNWLHRLLAGEPR